MRPSHHRYLEESHLVGLGYLVDRCSLVCLEDLVGLVDRLDRLRLENLGLGSLVGLVDPVDR